MKKFYIEHERQYKRMKKEGIPSYSDLNEKRPKSQQGKIDKTARIILGQLLPKPWVPKGGKVIELGCGTGTILRWVCDRGDFQGIGVDVSRTAIAMAREQSKGHPCSFRCADLCGERIFKPASFDLVIDGHCLHCITQGRDRKAFLRNAFDLLRPGGAFIVLSMCGPVDKKGLAARGPDNKRLRGGVCYIPWHKGQDYEGLRTIQGIPHAPVRIFLHWQDILKELRRAGFALQWHMVERTEPTGGLVVVATKP